jgi:hypothetical protein
MTQVYQHESLCYVLQGPRYAMQSPCGNFSHVTQVPYTPHSLALPRMGGLAHAADRTLGESSIEQTPWQSAREVQGVWMAALQVNLMGFCEPVPYRSPFSMLYAFAFPLLSGACPLVDFLRVVCRPLSSAV